MSRWKIFKKKKIHNNNKYIQNFMWQLSKTPERHNRVARQKILFSYAKGVRYYCHGIHTHMHSLYTHKSQMLPALLGVKYLLQTQHFLQRLLALSHQPGAGCVDFFFDTTVFVVVFCAVACTLLIFISNLYVGLALKCKSFVRRKVC